MRDWIFRASWAERARAGLPVIGRLLVMYGASRVVVLVAVSVGALVSETPLLTRLNLWDGAWYTAIAVKGYPPVDPRHASFDYGDPSAHTAFFPLYPMVIRLVSVLTPFSPWVAAVLVSMALGGIATALLWLLARRFADAAGADRVAALFVFFPGAFVFSVAYSEALMLTLAIACLIFLLDHRWALAGAMAALATASRPNAAVLVVCCAWAAAAAVLRDRDWKALIAPALAPVGIAGFFLFLWRRTGEPLAWFLTQRSAWHEGGDVAAVSVEAAARVLHLRAARPIPPDWLVIGGLGFALIAVGLLIRWRPPAVMTIYAVGIIALAVTSQTLGARPRFVLTAFPLIMAVARVTTGWHFQALLGASAALLAVTTVLYAVVDPYLGVP